MSEFGPLEHVFIEIDWWDGPIEGIANVNGVAHRFLAVFDEEQDEYSDTLLVWPISADEFELEQEQWRIFVRWCELREAGAADSASHPANPGVDMRWDELSQIRKPLRTAIPSDARRAKLQLGPAGWKRCHSASGTGYMVSWALI